MTLDPEQGDIGHVEAFEDAWFQHSHPGDLEPCPAPATRTRSYRAPTLIWESEQNLRHLAEVGDLP